ncbi:chromate efflux transporter [Xenophilus arseniciresistens]|uniref:Chromate efflux transporter n=1 Tax=Xenophilus arseniciresistens TaxID=1283306 RepID=A0AAE3N5S7_9BURK|nr:chromate efflux transporter [Xenophilus arseniciresistens]MDA7416095.1 chromate efflux transporter [Xenophilus arseniciresistens]
MNLPETATAAAPRKMLARIAEVFVAFLALGLTSFGGPIAHLGYFRTAFVERRRWLDEAAYAELVALCQFLPGPTSSQVGFALGLARAGWGGALAAWTGFTLPSAALLIALALGLAQHAHWLQSGAVHGLKVAAVAVVAQAVWQMGRGLCPDAPRRLMALGAAVLALALPGLGGQLLAIALAALLGARLLRQLPQPGPSRALPLQIRARTGGVALGLFLLLLLGLPLLAAWQGPGLWSLLDGVYRAGALVFGGGHVVLPMLQSATVDAGHLGADQFLAGYGAAQAVPGPLFSVAAYLGAAMQAPLSGVAGGLLLLGLLFVPGLLLLVAALPFWARLRSRPGARAALAGVNAAVTGLLAAALYRPLWTSAIHGPADVALAAAALALLLWGRASPLLVVLLAAAAGWALSAA